ncbi:MAG: DNA translocase FtsK 4TM domain-containing protein [Thermoguttaceae bacterium]
MPQRLFGLLLFALLVFLSISLFSFSAEDGRKAAIFPLHQTVHNLCGPVGATCAKGLFDFFGLAAYFLPVPLLFGICIYFSGYSVSHFLLRQLGFVFILCGISAGSAFFLAESPFETVVGPGGYLGSLLKVILSQYFALIGSYVFLSSLLLSGLVLSCDYSLMRIGLWIFGIAPIGQGLLQKILERPENERPEKKLNGKLVLEMLSEVTPNQVSPQQVTCNQVSPNQPFERQLERQSGRTKRGSEIRGSEMREFEDHAELSLVTPHVPTRESKVGDRDGKVDVGENPVPEKETENHSFLNWFKLGSSKDQSSSGSENEEFDESEEYASQEEEQEEHEYELPSLELLTPSVPVNYEQYESTVKRQAKQLEKAFFDFGFNVRVVEIQTGPVIAQFEVQLERGLRLNKILGLTDDLAIALKVPSVRIVAPIPGKNTVGVEIPNEQRQIVRLREVIEETAETAQSMYIPIFLGKDVSGHSMVIDLTKLPHLLIAGRTGTGKSVCLNSIIVSILMTRGPEDVRMIMIDPKMVEMSSYKSIPHLMHPVVTDMKKAEAILGWAVEKMEQRYQLLARAGVRQLSEYNKLSEEELYDRIEPESDEEWAMLPKSLPYMVIVADEMADLMMTSAKEVETHIIRLAQKSRAVGIHLVLATQKPTVDIITGLIKSNLPARIAFEVASRSDSQVVLDRNGAEKLLGNGDMLFLQPGTSLCLRGQGTYVSDKEIDTIIAEISTEEPEYAEELVALQIEGEEEEEGDIDPRDALYEKAVECVIREGRGSLSLLQRKLSIGYSRAARLIDIMAEDGVVGTYNGSQAREVITTLQEWRRRRETAAQEAAIAASSTDSFQLSQSSKSPQSTGSEQGIKRVQSSKRSQSTQQSQTTRQPQSAQPSQTARHPQSIQQSQTARQPQSSEQSLLSMQSQRTKQFQQAKQSQPVRSRDESRPIPRRETGRTYSPVVPTLQVQKKTDPVYPVYEEELDDMKVIQEEGGTGEWGYEDIPFDVESEETDQDERECEDELVEEGCEKEEELDGEGEYDEKEEENGEFDEEGEYGEEEEDEYEEEYDEVCEDREGAEYEDNDEDEYADEESVDEAGSYRTGYNQAS